MPPAIPNDAVADLGQIHERIIGQIHERIFDSLRVTKLIMFFIRLVQFYNSSLYSQSGPRPLQLRTR